MIAPMKKLFGTDGMRGEAGGFPLDAAAGRTAGRSLAGRLAEKLGRGPRVVAGRDTRESGAWIESAFLGGAREAGARVESAGVITTPGVAYLAHTLPADAGVVVSASHNPFQDNGIKIFVPAGRKLDDATERLIEADIYAERESDASPGVIAEPQEAGESVAEGDEGVTEESASRSSELRAQYLNYLAEDVAAGLSLEGLRIVVDCANGAASELAPALLARLGARATSINDAPDGRNINRDCGSLHMEEIGRAACRER